MKNIRRFVCLLLYTVICNQAMGKGEKDLNIVFIGNSITQGALLEDPVHEAPPVKAALFLAKQPGVASVKYSNRGVSGCTTTDYLPQTETLFPKAVAAANSFQNETWATLVFSISLGTNDSAIVGPTGAPTSPARYYENMKAILDKLLALYPDCKIVLHRPLWYSPNTYNAAKYMEEGLVRLQSYYPELQSLVLYYSNCFPGQVLMGDTDGFDYFKAHVQTDFHPEEGNAGVFYLHPNKKGAAVLGELWGKAIYKQLID